MQIIKENEQNYQALLQEGAGFMKYKTYIKKYHIKFAISLGNFFNVIFNFYRRLSWRDKITLSKAKQAVETAVDPQQRESVFP